MSDRDGPLRPAYGVAVPPRPVPARDVNLALAMHLAGGILAVVGLLANLVVLLALVPSLALFLASRREPGWRREEARSALNFQITWVAVTIAIQGVALALTDILVANKLVTLALSFFTVLLLIQSAIALFDLIASSLAAARARKGGGFRYPLRLEPVR